MKSIQQQRITQAQVDNSSINTVCEFDRQHEYVKYYTIFRASFHMIDGWYQSLVCTWPTIISSWHGWHGHPDPAFRQMSGVRERCQWQWWSPSQSSCSRHHLYPRPAVTESGPEWPDDDDYERCIEDVLITSLPCLSRITRIHHHSWSGHKKRSSDYNRGCPQNYKLKLTSVVLDTTHIQMWESMSNMRRK